MKKCYSTDNDNFRHDSIAEILEALDDDGLLRVGQVYYEADCQPLALQKMFDAEQIVERADEIGFDLIGEEAWVNPLAVSDEAITELQVAITAWAAKHVDVSRYYEIVGKTRERTVTEADMAANAE